MSSNGLSFMYAKEAYEFLSKPGRVIRKVGGRDMRSVIEMGRGVFLVRVVMGFPEPKYLWMYQSASQRAGCFRTYFSIYEREPIAQTLLKAAVIDYVFYHGGARPAQQVEHDVNRVFDRLGLRTHVCSFARIFVEQFEAFYGRK